MVSAMLLKFWTNIATAKGTARAGMATFGSLSRTLVPDVPSMISESSEHTFMVSRRPE